MGNIFKLFTAIMTQEAAGFGLGRREPTTPLQERKFRNLKLLIVFLQEKLGFGKYCYYGCHCLPEGSHDIAGGGVGEPKDRFNQFNQKESFSYLQLFLKV